MAHVPHERSRAAIVHDFFVQDGGAERCAIELAELLPTATVHTTFFDAQRFGPRLSPGRVRTWPLQRLTGAMPHFRALLPLYPAWYSLLDLRHAELVVSSSVAFAKAVRTSERAVHISYVYTPMRYAWDLDDYLARSSYSLPARIGARTARPLLRAWDRRSGRRPDVLVAISHEVRRRIRRLWGRDARVIYPPVDTDVIRLSDRDDGFYLVAARLLAYRRLDLAIEACRVLGRELFVVGEGPERSRLERLAGGATVRFLGHVDRASLVDLFGRCHAYLLPGVEDFGIAPLEAAAAGKPVVAYRGGGALETVRDGLTGVFFDRPEAGALADAMVRLDGLEIDRNAVRGHARRFDRQVFLDAWRDLLAEMGVDASLYAPSVPSLSAHGAQ
ncbi:glycosyltransferase [soil metagenome]|jgi:glycosyltransferase involved in cell wall biosynthesis